MLHTVSKFLIIIHLVVGWLLSVGCSKKNDISGAWKGRIALPETGKVLSDLEFSFKQKGKEIDGIMFFTKPMEKLPLTGSVNNGKISLSSSPKNGLMVSITGVIESHGKITGEALLDYEIPKLGKKQDKARIELTR